MGFEFGEDEAVDGRLNPGGVLDWWRWGLVDWLERPVFGGIWGVYLSDPGGFWVGGSHFCPLEE